MFGVLLNDTVLIRRMFRLHSGWPKVITSEPCVSGPEVRCMSLLGCGLKKALHVHYMVRH